jgi:septum formation protein
MTTPELVVSLRHHLHSTYTDISDPDKIRLILASQSPRRKEILDMMGLQGKFQVKHSPLDETAMQKELKSMDPVEYTRILAEQKTMALAQTLPSTTSTTTTLILGSDTIVVYGGSILEKPVDEADAVRMLGQLQGKRYVVHTGVALVRVDSATTTTSGGVLQPPRVQLMESFTDTATVQFAPLTEADIAAYVATGEPMDKAGSYGIQGVGGQLVSAVEGDFFTVRFGLFAVVISFPIVSFADGSLTHSICYRSLCAFGSGHGTPDASNKPSAGRCGDAHFGSPMMSRRFSSKKSRHDK